MQLKAGILSMIYENGFLRWINTAGHEVIRMIYFAVRDKNWGTISGKIQNEKIEKKQQSFHISYEMLCKLGEINMYWKVNISGADDSTVLFEIEGKALSTFQKNRAGFCVLHPIKECAGSEVLITSTDGTKVPQKFPNLVSPLQPFKNVSAMQWKLDIDLNVHLSFWGDTFETEDHRNWTDYNFKTYCTPLNLPFPQTLNKGEIIRQKVCLKVSSTKKITNLKRAEDIIQISVSNEYLPIPKIGIGRASKRNTTYLNSLSAFKAIGFRHYRVDITLSSGNWEEQLNLCIKEAASLKTKLEIALFLQRGCRNTIQDFGEFIKNKNCLQQIILFEEHEKCISNVLVHEAVGILRPLLPGIPIGAGTDIYFAELNRSSLDAFLIDFVNYSANPQVHATDNATIMENAFGQIDLIKTAMYKFNKPVHVSPVTLKMRYNADATDPVSRVVPKADKRQSENFGAAWTLASIKALAENSAASITYYETIGERGIGMNDNKKGVQFYPVSKLLAFVLAKHHTEIIRSNSTKPFEVCSLVFPRTNEMLIANLTGNEKIVHLLSRLKFYSAKDLITGDFVAVNHAMTCITLAPFQTIVAEQYLDG